jgi:hypothetical protein
MEAAGTALVKSTDGEEIVEARDGLDRYLPLQGAPISGLAPYGAFLASKDAGQGDRQLSRKRESIPFGRRDPYRGISGRRSLRLRGKESL